MLVSPAFLPGLLKSSEPLGLAALALTGGLLAGFFEEVGWTGFATPRLLERHGWLAAWLVLGLPWWAWHALGDRWGGAGHGGWYLPHFLLRSLALPAYRVLMTRVYAGTGSLLIAALMHAAFNGGQGLLQPAWTTAANAVLWHAAFALALLVAVVFVVLTDRGVVGRPGAAGAARPVEP